MSNRTYSEMIKLPTFEERYRYLALHGSVGADTFGFDRYLNQKFYNTQEWRSFRNSIVLRDDGCDLGMPDKLIHGRIYIHHIVPITKDDVINRSPSLFDPNNVVCCSFETHNAIHYGYETSMPMKSVERTANDTCPWKG